MFNFLDWMLISGALLIPYLAIASAFVAMALPGGGGGEVSPPTEYVITLTRK